MKLIIHTLGEIIFTMIDGIALGCVAFYLTLNRKPQPYFMVMLIQMNSQYVLSHAAFNEQFQELNPVDPEE